MFDFTWKEMFAGPVNFVKSFLHCYFIYHYKERCHCQWERIKPRTEEWQIIILFWSFTDFNSPANQQRAEEGLTNGKASAGCGSGLVFLRANPYLSLSTFLAPWLWARLVAHFLLLVKCPQSVLLLQSVMESQEETLHSHLQGQEDIKQEQTDQLEPPGAEANKVTLPSQFKLGFYNIGNLRSFLFWEMPSESR